MTIGRQTVCLFSFMGGPMKKHKKTDPVSSFEDQEFGYKQTHGGRMDFRNGEWGRSGEFARPVQFRESDSYDKREKLHDQHEAEFTEASEEPEESSQVYSRSRFAEPYTGGEFARTQYGIGAQYSRDWVNTPSPMTHFGKGPKGYVRSDERIREDVCETLYQNPAVDASDVTVKVVDGCVWLEGTIPDRATKREVEICIEHLPGVVDVINQLQLRM